MTKEFDFLIAALGNNRRGYSYNIPVTFYLSISRDGAVRVTGVRASDSTGSVLID